MTPQERQMVDDLFDRLAKMESAPRDPDATAAMAQGLRAAPNAVYALVQTVLVQDEALKQAHHRIEELEAAGAPQQQQSGGGFLDSMRDSIFGQGQPHGSVPNVPPPRDTGSRPVWNSGQVLQQGQPPGRYDQTPYGQPYGAPQGQMGGPMGGAFGGAMGGGGSFLGTAAAAAAGMVGGSLLLNSFRGMMGGSRQAFGDTAVTGNRSPWSDQSNSSLARDAGVNDVGSKDLAAQDRAQDLAQDRDDDNLAAQDRAQDLAQDHDDMDLDSDDFGGDNDSDYA
ncbi:MAG: DUF2076 domain-containing protein [Bradyrhizobium sp.]